MQHNSLQVMEEITILVTLATYTLKRASTFLFGKLGALLMGALLQDYGIITS